jgi:5'-nucleotidase
LNLNVPPGGADRIKGIRVTRQSALAGTEHFEEHNNPRGRRYFWNSYQDATTDEEGTDVWATSVGYVAVTPLHVSEFDRETFEQWKDQVR